MNSNVLSLLDLNRLEWIRLVYLDCAGRGAANPWAVTWTPDGRDIVVTHAGTHEVSLVESPVLPQKPVRVRTRIKLSGEGPRALAVAGSMVYAAEYFSDSLSAIDLSQREPEPVELQIGGRVERSPQRYGEALFNDATFCHQQWQSCASCHDADGRVDALNWDLLNDGIGNPKNAKSLLWSHRTPPVMALGVRPNAQAAVRAGIKYILFAQPPEEIPAAIDEYLQSLQPAPSPSLVGGKLSAAAERGRVLFADPIIGCSRCHPGPLFTDLKKHDVGTRGGYDAPEDRFDTPTLVELWRTAPYLHDGSAATLQDLFTTRNAQDMHGHTTHLRPEKIDDLVAYLLSL
jgi:cytochrome c peroxidase